MLLLSDWNRDQAAIQFSRVTGKNRPKTVFDEFKHIAR